jgi:hypothetical protein
MATIGDWEVTIIKEETEQIQPGNPEAGIQRTVSYNFKYIPLNSNIPRMITFVRFHAEDKVLEFLVDLVVRMKTGLIDRTLSST